MPPAPQGLLSSIQPGYYEPPAPYRGGVVGLRESKMGGREPACTWFLGLHPESTPRASEEACAHEVLCARLWGRGLPQPAGC